VSSLRSRNPHEPTEEVTITDGSEIQRFLEERDIDIAEEIEQDLEKEQETNYRLKAELRLQGNFKNSYESDLLYNREICMYTQGAIISDKQELESFETVYNDAAQDAFNLDYGEDTLDQDFSTDKAKAD